MKKKEAYNNNYIWGYLCCLFYNHPFLFLKSLRLIQHTQLYSSSTSSFLQILTLTLSSAQGMNMDSGNSASIQSSSTGGGSRGGREDQEFESRGGETISALLNPTSLASFDNTVASSQLYSINDGSSFSAYHQQHQVPNYKFDPPTFSQSMMINHNNNNNTNNSNIVGNDNSGGDINNSLGLVWPNKYTLVQPSSINTYSLSLDDASNSTSSVINQQINTCATQSHQLQRPPLPVPSSMDSTRVVKSSPGSLNQQGGGGGGRSNPKKRSRASRRTPTTVLTTDTNNFRQMVQEFTGIPASPFETAFAGRARLDLFGGFGIQFPRDGERVIPNNNGSSMLDVCSSTMQPPHFIRPFPQNIIATPNNYPKVVTTPSFLPRPATTTTVEKFHVSGFRQGDPTTSRGSKATGHNICTTTATTTTSTCATTTRSAIGRHQVNSVDEGGGNQGGVTRGETTVDSWICSSD